MASSEEGLRVTVKVGQTRAQRGAVMKDTLATTSWIEKRLMTQEMEA